MSAIACRSAPPTRVAHAALPASHDNGAIAQNFRGPVGTGGASITSGYVKNYNYDDRLRYTTPPYFLSPIQAPWDVFRFNEQTPAQ